jgi:hypothetical protein
MMQHEPSISADSISTAAPAGFSVTQRQLGRGMGVNVITGTPPGQEHLYGRWDGTQMVKDHLLGRMRWDANAVVRYVQLTGARSHEELVFHGGGQGHQWLDANLAAFLAAQSYSPRCVDFAGVSEACVCVMRVRMRMPTDYHNTVSTVSS